jgi:hypothetical protein
VNPALRLLTGLLLGAGCTAQVSADPAARAQQLVVRVTAKVGQSDVTGSGIIVGRNRERMYVITANHVVRNGTDQATEVRVYFRWLPGESSEAVLLEHFDPEMDLAVIAIPNPPVFAVAFDQLAPARSVKVNDGVYLVGFPGGALDVNPAPQRITSILGHRVRFRSDSIAAGHSGGGLFNERHELIGMVRNDLGSNTGEAVRIDLVLDALRDPSWNYPVSLREPASSPRAGRSVSSTGPTEPIVRLIRTLSSTTQRPASAALLVIGSLTLSDAHSRQFEVIAREMLKHRVMLSGIAFDSKNDFDAVRQAFESIGEKMPLYLGHSDGFPARRAEHVLMVNFETMEFARARDITVAWATQALGAGKRVFLFANSDPWADVVLPRTARERGGVFYAGTRDSANLDEFFRSATVAPNTTPQSTQTGTDGVWKKFYDDLRSARIEVQQPVVAVKLWLGSVAVTDVMAQQLADLPQQFRENGILFAGIACASAEQAAIVNHAFAAFGGRMRVYESYESSIAERDVGMLLMNFDPNQNRELERAVRVASQAGKHVYIYPNPNPIFTAAIQTMAGETGTLVYPGKAAPGGVNVGWFLRALRERQRRR